MEPSILIVGGLILLVIAVIVVIVVRAGRKVAAEAPAPSASRPSVRLNWLIGISGPAEGKTFHIGARTVTIGRLVGSFVQLTEDDQVSRNHCQIRTQGGSLVIKDTDSNTGTFVNDTRVDEHILQDGDKIKIGQSIFEYRHRGDFGTNDGLGRKDASMRAVKPTMMGTQKSLQTMVFEALEEYNGDRQKAAESMDLPLEVFERILEDTKKSL